MSSFMFIAGEASGDTLGAELARALSSSAPGSICLFGAGGQKMKQAGVQIDLDLIPHAVVGIWEVLKNYGKFKGFFEELLQLALARRPDCIILIDYPGFNLRFVKAIRARARATGWEPRIVYYVSPQIWAWHESRIEQITRDIDLMLVIFPFEKDWYYRRKPNFKVEFVGHPLVDRFGRIESPTDSVERACLVLLPGSRERELRKHLPVMLPAARKLAEQLPVEIQMVLPNQKLHHLAQNLGNLEGIQIRVGELADALRSATAAIASSGTVTMECAYFGVPTVVIYKTSWSTYFLGRRFIKVKFLAMPNLLADREVYPELIQSEANPENIFQRTLELLQNSPRRAEVKEALREVISKLGQPGAASRAAAAVWKILPGR